jgi:hypothetical protein
MDLDKLKELKELEETPMDLDELEEPLTRDLLQLLDLWSASLSLHTRQ